MKKILIMLFCISVASSIFASETRVASFGDISFGDEVEVGTYPGLRMNFTNYFSATMGNPGDDNNYTAGVVFDLGPGVFALDLNKQSDYTLLDENGVPLENVKTLGLTYGMDLSGYNVGANVTFGSDMYLEEEGSYEYTKNTKYFGLGLGVSNDMFDFGFKLGLPTYERTTTATTDTLLNGDPTPDYTFGGSTLGLYARYLPLEFGGFKIIPKIGFGTGSFANQDSDVTYSKMQFGFNTIIGYDISEKTKAIFDVQLFGYKLETTDYADTLIDADFDKVETKTMGPFSTWKVGVESNIKPWLVGRFGAVKGYTKCTETTIPWDGDDHIETTFDETFKLTFGLGFKFGKFTIDVNFNEELLFTGPNFITGAEQDWASAISMEYSF